MTCSGHDEAQQRIDRAVHEIRVLCDHFGYDPSQWLADNDASRPDAEAIAAVPDLKGKNAVVLYFETDQDRREFVALVQEAKPGMRAVNL